MTRQEALAVLRRLAVGLGPDLAGVQRLLERISYHDEGEALRCALAEIGAERLIAEVAS